MTMTLFADPSGTLGKIQVNGVDILELTSSKRIRGDFSTTTLTERLAFQTSIPNGNTFPFILGNGTSVDNGLEIASSSDPTNCAALELRSVNIEARIAARIFGTGTYVPLTFQTGGAEAMRIDTSRNVLYGQTAVIPTNGATGIMNAGGANAGQIRGQGGAGYNFSIFYNSANSATIGSISNNAGTGTTYATSSDPRLKNTIAPLTGSGAIIDALNPVTWLWNSDGSPGAGFLAPDFQAIFPRAVTGVPDEVDVDLNPIYQMIDASTPEVMAVIVAELQDIRARLLAGGL